MRIDVGLDLSPLLQTLRDPGRLRRLSAPEFSRLIDVANQARLLGWLLTEIDARNMSEPAGWLGDRITTVRRRASEDERAVRWEIDRVSQGFLGMSLSLGFTEGRGVYRDGDTARSWTPCCGY